MRRAPLLERGSGGKAGEREREGGAAGGGGGGGGGREREREKGGVNLRSEVY
jgi:hypothetical protein